MVLVGLGVRQFFFPVPKAKADRDAATGPSMNVLQMHVDHKPNYKTLPAQTMNDMTFVFSGSD